MKKYLKHICIGISLVVLLGIIFFAIDYNRAINKERPIFCILKDEVNDGGTRIYLGLGYKVIDFHTINGFYETKIGTYFMKYEDFDDEISKCDDIVIDEIVKSEEYRKQIENTVIKLDLPKEWHYEEIDNPENQNAKFELKLYKNSKEKSASLYYYNEMFGVCGTGLISKKLNLDNGNEASIGYYYGSNIWDYVSLGNLNPNIAILNRGLDETESKELLGIIRTIIIENEYNKAESEKNIVSLKVDKTTITTKGAKFILNNNSDEEYTYGASYRVDVNENGIWKEAPLYALIAWDETAFSLKANTNNEINIDWTIGYGELKAGKYRLAKKVFKSSDVPIKENKTIEIYAEFDIK